MAGADSTCPYLRRALPFAAQGRTVRGKGACPIVIRTGAVHRRRDVPAHAAGQHVRDRRGLGTSMLVTRPHAVTETKVASVRPFWVASAQGGCGVCPKAQNLSLSSGG